MDSQKRRLSDGSVVMEEHKFPFDENLTKVTDQSKYNAEEERLKTFVSWPSDSAVDPARLAKSGFYYAGKLDEVICFSCHGHIKDWQYGDIVQRKHMELFPNCDFVNNKSTNIPLMNWKQMDRAKISRRLSEPVVNNVTPVTNGIQKHLSAAENLLLNISPKHLNSIPRPNGLNHVTRSCSEVKARQTPNISFNLETLFLEMKSEEKRLKTFKNGWPVPFINVEDLAKAGFFYLGKGDKVQCPFCGVIVSNWEVGDEPLAEHRRHFPKCTFLSTLGGRKSTSENSWYKGKGHDVCGPDESAFIPPGHSEHKLLDRSQEHTKLEELGVSLHRGPAHPQQATLAARLRSFISWPSTAPVKKEDLASAGFFYIGISDHTKCFHCDGGLCSWEDGDDPWVEHARWFCNCTFVRLNKGDDFIKVCVAKHSAVKNEVASSSSDSSSTTQDDILAKTEEAMSSSLIQAVLETGIFAPCLVRAAVMRQLKETGSSFSSVDDVCEAVAFLQHEMEVQPPQKIDIPNENLVATLNIEMQPEELMEEGKEEKMDISGIPLAKTEVTSEDSSQAVSNGNLEEENRFLKDQRLCKVCMDNDAGVVFLPCGHLLTCTLCAPALKICPLCRKSIQAIVRAYLP